MFQANILPGQGFMPFAIWEQAAGVTKTGRATYERPVKTDKWFYGILTNASEQEVEQNSQKGHPITHKITEYSAMVKAKETDILVLPDGRQFYIQTLKKPGNLNITMLYYVEERYDIKLKEANENG